MSSVSRALVHGLRDRIERATGIGDGCGDDHQAAETAGAGLAVEHLHPPGLAFVGHDAGRFARALTRARQATGDVDRDDIAASPDERLITGQEVAHRRLGGRRQLW